MLGVHWRLPPHKKLAEAKQGTGLIRGAPENLPFHKEKATGSGRKRKEGKKEKKRLNNYSG